MRIINACSNFYSKYCVNKFPLVRNIRTYILILLTLTSCEDHPWGGVKCFENRYYNNDTSELYTEKEVPLAANGLLETDSNTINTATPDDYGKWLNTGITIEAGTKLILSTSGEINLCKFTKYTKASPDINYFTSVYSDGPDTPANYTFPVVTGDLIQVKITDSNDQIDKRVKKSSTATYDCSSATGYQDDCWGTNGIGVNIWVGDSSPVNNINRFFKDQFSRINSGIQFTATSSGQLHIGSPPASQESINNGSYTFEVVRIGCPTSNGRPTNQNMAGAVEMLISNHNPNKHNNSSDKIILPDGTYSNFAPNSGKIWLRVVSENPVQNIGSYNVHIKYETYANSNFTTNLINKIIPPIKQWLDRVTQISYTNFVRDNSFQKAVKACLILYIIIYAIGFMYGLVRVSQYDLVIRLFKMSMIFILISDRSWTFFSQYLIGVFRDGSEYLIHIATGSSGDSKFAFLSEPIDAIFNSANGWKIFAILATGPSGWFLAGTLIYAMIMYLLTIVEAVIAYLISLIALAILITVAPIFLIFMLFNYTKSMFDAWVKYLLNFALQPVVLFAGIMFMVQLVLINFYKIFSYEVCWNCIVPLHIKFSEDFIIDLKTCIFFYSLGNDGSFLTSILPLIIASIIYAKLLRGMTDLAPLIVNAIIGAAENAKISLSGSGSLSNQAVTGTLNKAKSATGQSANAIQSRVTNSQTASAKKDMDDQ
jgi:type IV secretion system protein VirB6